MHDKLFTRNGIWYAHVLQPGGGSRKVSTGCTDKRAAKLRQSELERDALSPADSARNQATTARILTDYLASRVRMGRSDGTLHHVDIKSRHLGALLPKRAAEITHSVVEGYVDLRLEQGARRTTIKKELRVLKAALSLAAKNDLFERAPATVIPELEDDYRPKKRALTPWEMVALVSNMRSPARAAHVVFIVATSASWGESQRVQRDHCRPGFVHLEGTKNKYRVREVPIVGEVAESMLAWALERAAPEGRLFARWINVRRDIHEACARAGIDPVSPNDLRRTFGTWLRNAGVAPNLIGAAMGHADSRMVERVYGRLTPEALSKLMGAAPPGQLMGGEPVKTSTKEGMGDAPEGPPEHHESSEIQAISGGAQRRNRTADTGIFNPRFRGSDLAERGELSDVWAANGQPHGICGLCGGPSRHRKFVVVGREVRRVA